MALNDYAYMQGYLANLPPAEKQRYQFMVPASGLTKSPEDLTKAMYEYFLSQKFTPVKRLPDLNDAPPRTPRR